MGRVNISLSDDLLERARAAGINISRISAKAIREEMDRQSKIRKLEAYLAEMEAEFGPIDPREAAEAKVWADEVLSGPKAQSA